MSLLIVFLILLVIALVFVVVIFVMLARANELNAKECGNCELYDRNLNTCWFRFEERYYRDKACMNFYRRDKDEVDNT